MPLQVSLLICYVCGWCVVRLASIVHRPRVDSFSSHVTMHNIILYTTSSIYVGAPDRTPRFRPKKGVAETSATDFSASCTTSCSTCNRLGVLRLRLLVTESCFRASTRTRSPAAAFTLDYTDPAFHMCNYMAKPTFSTTFYYSY